MNLAQAISPHIIIFVPLAERDLVSQIRRLAAKGSSPQRMGTGRGAVVAGIGDDCALLRIPAGHEVLVTTDFSLEGVHFRREWHSPQFIGHHCLTRGLSDIAAMGGDPIAAFLSLALPASIPQRWVNEFLKGLLKLAQRYGVSLAGGDITQSENSVLADIVVLGSVPRGKAILRSGARVGDRIYVTGDLGGAAAETDFLYEHPRSRARHSPAVPEPRITVARFLRERSIATAMIDISDGLSTDLSHVCEESNVAAAIFADAVPRATFRRQKVGLEFALHGGDAYELLFTARDSTLVPAKVDGVPISPIGKIVSGRRKITLIDSKGRRSPLQAQGWEHFRQGSPSK